MLHLKARDLKKDSSDLVCISHNFLTKFKCVTAGGLSFKLGFSTRVRGA